MEKQEIRKLIKSKQKEVFQTPHYISEESYRICRKICLSEDFKKAEIIFVFMSMKDEVNIAPVIMEAFMSGKQIAVPKITDKDGIMEFHWITPDTPMDEGAFGISEPSAANSSKTLVNMENVQTNALLLVPGLAFTDKGERLGRGKGFYDRFISAFGNRFNKIGVCFPFQILDSLPACENDMKVDKVVC